MQRFIHLSIIVVLLLLFPAVTKSKTQDNFFFDPAPTSQNVVEGQEVLLRCDVSNRKHIIFYWTIDGREVQNTSRRFQIGSDLNIRRVSRDDDGGSFRCIATNVTTGVSLSSLEARLNIYCKYLYCMQPSSI